MADNFFYHVLINDIPTDEGYEQVDVLYRSFVGGDITMERYDPETDKWVDDPSFIRVSGIGGAVSYYEVAPDEAAEIVEMLKRGEKPTIEIVIEEDDGAEDDLESSNKEAELSDGERNDLKVAEAEMKREKEKEVKKKSLTVSPVFGVIRGGAGSGNWGHDGLEGVHGGSSPGGGKQNRPTTYAGITSARPEKEAEEVFSDMAGFEKALRSIDTVSSVSVEPGTGGWEGGSEPTWVVSYDGNGKALMLLAETGQRFEQDAVLLYEACEGEGCSPVVDWSFSSPITIGQRETIEKLLVENGMGGWTWYQQDGLPVLRAVAIPQWGGEREAHLLAADKIGDSLNAAGIGYSRSDFEVKPTIMEKEGDFAYSKFLEKNNE